MRSTVDLPCPRFVRLRGVLLQRLAVTLGLYLAASGAACGDHNRKVGEPAPGLVEAIGQLRVHDPGRCSIPEGCGPRYQLRDSIGSGYVPLLGAVPIGSDRRIVRVHGEDVALPDTARHCISCRPPDRAIDLSELEDLSSYPPDTLLRQMASRYLLERFGMGLEPSAGWLADPGWGFRRGMTRPVLRFTNLLSSANPRPSLELWFDGETGDVLGETDNLGGRLTSRVGMLRVMSPDSCVIPEGCGPIYQLYDSSMVGYTPLLGAVEADDSRRIVEVFGAWVAMPDSARHCMSCSVPDSAILVWDMRALSTVRYDPFLRRAADQYTQEAFGCQVPWNKTYGWRLEEQQGGPSRTPYLIVRLTDTWSASDPKPFLELWFEGSNGAFAGRLDNLGLRNPCQGE